MWFYSHIGIDAIYFANESQGVISDHIVTLYSAKVLAYSKCDQSSIAMDLKSIDEKGNGAMFIHIGFPGMRSTEDLGATCEIK